MPETTETTPASTPPAPRTDRLELVKELGRGSIGVVHKARNPQLGRVIALRQFEVPEWLDEVNELLKKILAEARAASALDHTNIARLHTCGYKGFTVFMTSEFVEGQSLKELMDTRTPELSEVLALAKQLCAALDYAHDKGVFHHFLNPANIKVLPDGTLKVLDFGLLRDKHLLTQTPAKKLEGEPYLSPEQVKNKPPDRAANLFSAASILYQLYTARSPFAGQHLGEVDRAITDVTPHALNVAHPRVPEAISTVILKALSKAPASRFKSGKLLATALEDAMKGEPVRAATAKSAANSAAKPVTTKIPVVDSANQNVSSAPPRSVPAPATSKMKAIAPPTTTRVQVGNTNHWKLVASLAACLVVIVVLALVFQHRPTEVPAADGPQTKAVASSKPAPVEAGEPATPNPDSDSLNSTETFSAPTKHGKAARASRSTAAAVPAAPTEGQMFISSVPTEATVEIEGLAGQTWKTPQTIGALPPGTYKLTVSKLGYAPDTRSVQVNAGERAGLDVRLTAVKGFLNVAGSPAGASVLINGKDTGRVTPAALMLDPAVHNVVLRKSGYLDASTDIQLAAGQTVGYSPSLMVAGRTDNLKVVGGGMGKLFGGGGSSSGMAHIEIKSDPKGAQVIINGTPLHKTTPVEIQVEAGNYDITLQKEGYKSVHENAIVGIEDHVKIDKALLVR